MSNYYISDLHFGHKNCLAYDNRKFKDIETHDQFVVIFLISVRRQLIWQHLSKLEIMTKSKKEKK